MYQAMLAGGRRLKAFVVGWEEQTAEQPNSGRLFDAACSRGMVSDTGWLSMFTVPGA